MDGVKEYWQNPLFLVGVFLCAVGTIAAITGEHHIGVWSELAGFFIVMISISFINKNSETSHHH